MESREIGNEVRKNGRDARDELCLDEADSLHPHNSEAWPEPEQPINGDPVLDIEFILLERPIVPGPHSKNEYQ